MRVLAFDRPDAAIDPEGAEILGVARVDIRSNPALGCGVGRLMTARYHPTDATPRPFRGDRLRNAVWRPRPPDILVAAHPHALAAVPDGIRMGLPWIVVLTAWARLQAAVPTVLLGTCWTRGNDGDDDKEIDPGWGLLEREAWFTARALNFLLHHAPPDELVALSRAARP